MSWLAALMGKARGVHAEIAALQAYFAHAEDETPLTIQQVETAFAGHYAMLDDLYLNQIPFARAVENADFFLNCLGPKGSIEVQEWAGIGAVDRFFGNVRTQVATMTRAVIESGDPEIAPPANRKKARQELELAISAHLPGRYVGFSMPKESELDAPSVAQAHAMRQGLHNLGLATLFLSEEGALDRITTAIDDPEVRDATLGAVKKLLPYREKRIHAVELRGRALDLPTPASIDRRVWQIADRLMAQPVESAERATFTGHILQIDYELCRFELRWLEDPRLGEIRCAYPAALAQLCEQSAKRKVEVRGSVDFRRGRPRLVHVESIRVID